MINTYIGTSRIAQIELAGVESGLSDYSLNEARDITAQHLIRYSPMHPFTFAEKKFTLKNPTYVVGKNAWHPNLGKVKFVDFLFQKNSNQCYFYRTGTNVEIFSAIFSSFSIYKNFLSQIIKFGLIFTYSLSFFSKITRKLEHFQNFNDLFEIAIKIIICFNVFSWIRVSLLTIY